MCFEAHNCDVYKIVNLNTGHDKSFDEKILSWFAIQYNFYPTRCVSRILCQDSGIEFQKNSLDKNHTSSQIMRDPTMNNLQ